MKTLKEILDQDKIEDKIKDLKRKNITVKEWPELEKDYEPSKHKIFDKGLYPDKPIKDDKGNIIREEPICRVGIGLQKLAVKKMAEFLFTIPVNLVSENIKPKSIQEQQFNSIKKILKRNKWNTLNKARCKINSSECEQATYWYTVSGKNNHYGFSSQMKLKKHVFSPKNGDELYPLFDETGDMIAFSRGFSLTDENNVKTDYFETWTAEFYYKFQKGANQTEWEEIPKIKNPIGKIPIIYSYRAVPIWEDADNGKVHELEKLVSQNGDILSYHAAPVLIIKGDLQGAPTKSEANKVFVTSGDGGAEYVSWNQSPESVKFQFESLLRTYFMELQLPDLSFENIKGLGAASGEARKWLMADAHLKCGDESEIYEDVIDRELSVIKAYLGEMNTTWKGTINDLEIEAEFTPFIISDDKAKVDLLVSATGGDKIFSQRSAIERLGWSSDPDEEQKQIEREQQAAAMQDIGESVAA